MGLDIQNRRLSIADILFIVGVGFYNLFSFSGVAITYGTDKYLTYFTLILVFFSIGGGGLFTQFLRKENSVFVGGLLVVLLFVILIDYGSYTQLTNFVTAFFAGFWIKLFSRIRWNRERLLQIGIIMALVSLLLQSLFMPGRIWSGWNPNSPVAVFPLLFFSIAAIWSAKSKFTIPLVLAVSFLEYAIVSQLENRSGLMGLVLFLILLFTNFAEKSRTWFRIIYLSIIGINIGFPFLGKFITKTRIYNSFYFLILSMTNKDAGLNGREWIWQLAIENSKSAPLFGTAGVRTIYYHNFSLDLLTQFGWVGFVCFVIILISAFERIYKEGYRHNIFLIGFLCSMFVNTFENMFVADSYFTIFPYMLLGVAWSITDAIEQGEEYK